MSSTPKLTSERAAAILNEVPPEKAFYFYRGMDSPLNKSARSLKEFCEQIRVIDPESISFHSSRQDFENWVAMLGDAELSRRLRDVRNSKAQGENLRTKLYSTSKNRVDQLQRATMKIPR